MILYHGSNVIVQEPQILENGFYKDFGYGFYCTILEKQAKRWALTKRRKHIVNFYEYSPDKSLNQCHLDKIKKEYKDKGTAFSKCHLEELKTIRSYKLMEKGKNCMTKKQVYICF